MNQNPPLSGLSPLEKAYYAFNGISEFRSIIDNINDAVGFAIDELVRLQSDTVLQENSSLRAENLVLREQLAQYRVVAAQKDAAALSE